jgi:hypothetical protein
MTTCQSFSNRNTRGVTIHEVNVALSVGLTGVHSLHLIRLRFQCCRANLSVLIWLIYEYFQYGCYTKMKDH